MNVNLIIGLTYLVVGVALLIGGVFVPLIYTVIPIKRGKGSCPMNLVWRLVVKGLFAILILKDSFIHLYVVSYSLMPPRLSYELLDIAVIVGLFVALIATWITHPDHMKSV